MHCMFQIYLYIFHFLQTIWTYFTEKFPLELSTDLGCEYMPGYPRSLEC